MTKTMRSTAEDLGLAYETFLEERSLDPDGDHLRDRYRPALYERGLMETNKSGGAESRVHSKTRI